MFAQVGSNCSCGSKQRTIFFMLFEGRIMALRPWDEDYGRILTHWRSILFSQFPCLEALSATTRKSLRPIESKLKKGTDHQRLYARGKRSRMEISPLYCCIMYGIRNMSLNERMMVEAGFRKKEMLYYWTRRNHVEESSWLGAYIR